MSRPRPIVCESGRQGSLELFALLYSAIDSIERKESASPSQVWSDRWMSNSGLRYTLKSVTATRSQSGETWKSAKTLISKHRSIVCLVARVASAFVFSPFSVVSCVVVLATMRALAA